MKLPVTSESSLPSPAELWRRFASLAVDHALAYGEELAFDSIAACVRGVIGDDALTRKLGGTVVFTEAPQPATVVIDVIEAYEAHDAAPPRRALAPDADGERDVRLAHYGYRERPHGLLRLQAAPIPPAALESNGIVLPGRAAREAFAHAANVRAQSDPAAVLLPRHLDDPQYESIVALRAGRVVATVGLQIRGQAGSVCDLWTARADDAIASVLLGRAIELAARAQLTDVFAASPVGDEESMFDQAGFVAVREFVEWTA